ncbi:MAG: hypothetical protein MUD09_04010, partial [Desulfobacterales bacterium]|nr:hypothetical protein [Desulfobacterales bacterium]
MLTIMDDLKARRFEFTLKLKNELFLPPYKGAVFRGALCNSLKRITCAFRDRRPCANCALGKSCVYANIFEPMPPEDFPDGAKFICATPPYVLNPPDTLKRRFLPGETISFDLVLIEKAIDLLPYLVFAVTEIGRLGLTQNRAKFSLENVQLVAGD